MKWLHLSRDVEDCKRNNPPSAGYLRRGLETPLIFQTISMDFVGPRTYGGVEYHYAVILDHGSRYATTQASIGAPTSATACRMLMTTWIAIFGAPAVLITDRERYFDRRFADLVQTELGARWVRTTSGYPQANGMNETIHRSIEKSIAIRVQGREDLPFWKFLAEATFAYNTAPNVAMGTSPYQRVFGIEACLPGAQAIHGVQREEGRRQSQSEIRVKEAIRNIVETQRDVTLAPATTAQEGDLVVFHQNEQQYRREMILSGHHLYTSHWSLPCRVVEVFPTALKVQELHDKRASSVRIVALSLCPLLSSPVRLPADRGEVEEETEQPSPQPSDRL
eukprot:GHVS01034332.1.p1 GENE.GHVS01034332.1~~GHVS01034332.1.p1  ORF type:complete len:336 (-),score=16.76 GHVS01034332.1:164-1171(-)